MEQGNYLRYSVAATFGLILCLLALHVIPEFDIGPLHFKRVSILSDILYHSAGQPSVAQAPADTVPTVRPVYEDTCRTGLTCIEDFSADSGGMRAYLSALDSSHIMPVRIAFFSDSYVEGDIMLEPFRDSMQALYGGSGVGFVPITSEVASFRQTIIHTFQHWDTYSIVGERSDDHPLGPAGLAFVSKTGSEVEYKAPKHGRDRSLPTSQLFYRGCGGCAIIRDYIDTVRLTGTDDINAITLNGNDQSITISVPGSKLVDLYGMSFEAAQGISVDNFSVRGNSGMGLNLVSEDMYRLFDSIHPYRLVVLSYGLNVANEKAQNYSGYAKFMSRVVQRIKKAFPACSILLVGCSDRGAKVDGDYMTMPRLKELVNVQRKVAADNGVCFWDLFQAMGGDSTMIRWVDMKPALANKDYTHLTFRGGKKVADILVGTLLYEKEKYDRKRKMALGNLLSSK